MEPRVTFNKNQVVRRKRRMRVLVVLILVALALLAVVIGFLRKPSFQISQINITGTKSLDPNLIERAAQKHISGFYAIVIPKTNALLFSKTLMNDFLIQTFPGIQSADTEFSTQNILNISITEKKPAYLWCAASCFFVDDSGVIYESAPTFSQGFFLEFSGSTPSGTISDSTNPIRERFSSINEFNQTVSVIESLATYPMHVIDVRYLSVADSSPTVSTAAGDVSLVVDQIKNSVIPNGATIYILQTQSAAEIAQSLDLVLADKNFQSEFSAAPGDLQYIDLRFSGKIYYKFGTPSVSSAGAAPSAEASTTSVSAPAKPAASAKKPVVTPLR